LKLFSHQIQLLAARTLEVLETLEDIFQDVRFWRH
jgi:hypothetical protein